MDIYISLLTEFVSKVLGAVQTRHSQNKRTEDEGVGVRHFVSLRNWINSNSSIVLAAIANDIKMFEIIMKQAARTLRTYIRTGVWNTVYWVKDSTVAGRIYYVWTPQNGRKNNPQEEHRIQKEMREAEALLHKMGYNVYGGSEGSKYHLDRYGYYARGMGKAAVAEQRECAYVSIGSGNVFELLAEFFGHDLDPYY